MSVTAPAASDTLAADLGALQRDGFVVLDGLLNEGQAKALAAEQTPGCNARRCEATSTAGRRHA
jgi:hypothetical protein